MDNNFFEKEVLDKFRVPVVIVDVDDNSWKINDLAKLMFIKSNVNFTDLL